MIFEYQVKILIGCGIYEKDGGKMLRKKGILENCVKVSNLDTVGNGELFQIDRVAKEDGSCEKNYLGNID